MKHAAAAGFTLIELMVVIVIIGILASIAIPKFAGVAESAKYAACRSNLRNIAEALELYRAENGEFPGAYQGHKWRELTYFSDYVQTEMRCPSTMAAYRFRISGRNYQYFWVRGWNGACKRNHGMYKRGVYVQ
ncbi:MAG: prepilin-type N-terminal cleavage/methylation domain-containing protein [Candidatus Fermentibacteraceae bacterium]|nr:prepilin-type N-terminal cleavage/methylation domain-containing protein [Candidatus Fermentibacteraceae bacterium]